MRRVRECRTCLDAAHGRMRCWLGPPSGLRPNRTDDSSLDVVRGRIVIDWRTSSANHCSRPAWMCCALSAWMCCALSAWMSCAFSPPSDVRTPPLRVIFASRARASERRIVNERELAQASTHGQCLVAHQRRHSHHFSPPPSASVPPSLAPCASSPPKNAPALLLPSEPSALHARTATALLTGLRLTECRWALLGLQWLRGALGSVRPALSVPNRKPADRRTRACTRTSARTKEGALARTHKRAQERVRAPLFGIRLFGAYSVPLAVRFGAAQLTRWVGGWPTGLSRAARVLRGGLCAQRRRAALGRRVRAPNSQRAPTGPRG
jgi:hypothetical protein